MTGMTLSPFWDRKSIEKGLHGLELGTDASKQLQKLIAENPEQEFAGIIEWSGIKKLGD